MLELVAFIRRRVGYRKERIFSPSQKEELFTMQFAFLWVVLISEIYGDSLNMKNKGYRY